MADSLNYDHWKRRNAVYLKRFTGKTAVVTFSGGKDSSVALDLMQRASEEYGFSVEAHGSIFPKHVLTAGERERIDDYWAGRGIRVEWHQVPAADEEMDRAVSEGRDPCRICNQSKKSALLEDFASTGRQFETIVAVMGYSLWDIVSAVTEHLLAARFQAVGIEAEDRDRKLRSRHLETFQRFYPWMVFGSGLAVYKPLIFYNDQEIKQHVAQRGLTLSEIPCRFKDCRPKRILAQYYHRMQLSFDYERLLQFVRGALDLPEAAEFENGDEQQYLRYML